MDTPNESGQTNTRERNILGWLFLAPAIILFVGFKWLPMLGGFILSLLDWDTQSPAKYVGMANYTELFHDPLFHKYLGNSIFLAVVQTLAVSVLAIILALALRSAVRARKSAAFVLLLPAFVPLTVATIVWRWAYNPDHGIWNRILHIHSPWLTSVTWAKPAMAIVNIWYMLGIATLVTFLALRDTPSGNTVRRVLRLALLGIPLILAVQVFTLPYILTQGGPAGSTTTAEYYAYNNLYQWFKVGYGSAISSLGLIFLLVLGVVFTRASLKVRITRLSSGSEPVGRNAWRYGAYTGLVFAGVLVLLPILNAFVTGLKQSGEVFQSALWFPAHAQWSNLRDICAMLHESHFLSGNLKYWLMIALIHIPVSCMAAYSLSVLKPKGWRAALYLIVPTIFLSGFIVDYPVFVAAKLTHTLHLLLPIILMLSTSALPVVILKAWFDGTAAEEVRASRSAGMSERAIFFKKILPRSVQPVIIIGLMLLIIAMNDAGRSWIISILGYYNMEWTVLMALASVLTILGAVLCALFLSSGVLRLKLSIGDESS